MAAWDDVARVCRALPGTTEAVSASGRRRWSVLVRLDVLDEQALTELATEAWASRAPARLVTETLASG